MKQEYERKMKKSLKDLNLGFEDDDLVDSIQRAPSVHGEEDNLNPNHQAYLDIETKNAEF